MGRISTSLFRSALVGAAILLGITACNEHPVSFVQPSTTTEVVDSSPVGASEKVDILWTIDNSGSMCRSQQVLREGIDQFINELQTINVDFHIGVTTTHMDEESFTEPFAQPGHLQAIPQPIPSFFDECSYPVFSNTDDEVQNTPDGPPRAGDPDPRSLGPVVDNLETAIACTENPEDWQHLLNFDEDKLRCALPRSLACDADDPVISMDASSDFCVCDNNQAEFPNCIDCSQLDYGEIEDYFPHYEETVETVIDEDGEEVEEVVVNNPFRDIPLVLRSQDYQDEGGNLDVERLRDDFACMSLVGTRGSGQEQGLNAAVTALSEDLTGGTYESLEEARQSRDDHPNAGFLREDARTGIIFVTDENDCSYEGNLDTGECTRHGCTLAEQRLLNPDIDCDTEPAGCLTAIDELVDRLIENVAHSREDIEPEELTDSERAWVRSTILPASIHGTYQDLPQIEAVTGEPVPDYCPDERVEWADEYEPGSSNRWVVPPSCRSIMGVGWSGHRYAQFLGHFPDFFPRPSPRNQSPPEIGGEICESFENTMAEIGAFLGSDGAGCVDNIYPCSGPDDASCPTDRYTGEDGQCMTYPGFNTADDDARFYCDTGIEVRLQARDTDEATAREQLEATGYCIDDTFDHRDFPNTCVVDPERYNWDSCTSGMSIEWVDQENYLRILSDLNVLTRYATFSSASSDDGDDNSDNDNAGDDE